MPNFAGFFREKPDSGSGKPDTWSRNLFVFKHIWVEVSITWEFQPNWSNNTLKSGFFRISGSGIQFSGSGIRFFPEKSVKIGQKSGLTVYHDVIHHFSYSNHGEFIFGTKYAIWSFFFQNDWKIFKDKGKIHQMLVT